MARVQVKRANSCPNLDFVPLDAAGRRTVEQNAPECSLSLEANHEDGGFLAPEPILQPMTDAARLAHPARGDDNVKLVKPVESLTLLNALGEADVMRGEGPDQRGTLVHFGGMA